MGFSYKLGGWKKAEWQKRWLVLETWNTLYWFKSQGVSFFFKDCCFFTPYLFFVIGWRTKRTIIIEGC